MSFGIVELELEVELGEGPVIKVVVDLSAAGVDSLDGYTAVYRAVSQGSADPSVIELAGQCAGNIITVTIPASSLIAATYAHRVMVSGGGDPELAMRGWLVVTDWLSDAGAHYFTIGEARALDEAFSNTTKYTDQAIKAVRDAVEQAFETDAMCAFCPRKAKETLSGTGTRKLCLSNVRVRDVTALRVNGAAASLTGLKAMGSVLWREEGWPAGFANVEVEYLHGLDAPPAPVKRAALIAAKEYLKGSGLPARATAASINDMLYRITIAGRDGYFGIPEVDATLAEFGCKRPVVG